MRFATFGCLLVAYTNRIGIGTRDGAGPRRAIENDGEPGLAGKPAEVESYRSATPTAQLGTMADIVGATVFLLENQAMNGMDLIVDGGSPRSR